MKYAKQYPDLNIGETSKDKKVRRTLKKEECMVCGELTDFERIDIQAPLCSDDCFNRIRTNDDGHP